jgi:hypothetical protein
MLLNGMIFAMGITSCFHCTPGSDRKWQWGRKIEIEKSGGFAAGPQLSTLSFCLAQISGWYLVAGGWVDSRFAANAPLQAPDGASSPNGGAKIFTFGGAAGTQLSTLSFLSYSLTLHVYVHSQPPLSPASQVPPLRGGSIPRPLGYRRLA